MENNMIMRVGVGAIVLSRTRAVLLLRSARPPERGFWTIPGGAAEPGEGPMQAIQRELREEIGVVANDLRLITHFRYADDPGGPDWNSALFLLSHLESEPCNSEPAAHDALEWFDLDTLPDHLTK